MRTSNRSLRRPFHLTRSVEIDARVDLAFLCWTEYESLPRLMESVRRVKRIDDHHTLWDADIAGRQVVWEAHTVECIPDKLIRWESSWGSRHRGQVRFESLSEDRTRLDVEIELRPEGVLEHLGARLGLVGAHVGRDLARFRQFVERLPVDRD